MNQNIKRYRQTSILESFGFNKRPKLESSICIDSGMDKKTNKCEAFLDVDEKRAMSSSEPALWEAENICQAVKDSVKIKTENGEVNTEKSQQPTIDEDKYRISDDLFPSQPSTEENSIPGTSNSEELFPDSKNDISESDSESTSDSDEINQMSLLNRVPDCSLPLPKLEPSGNHSIMFSPHIRPGDAPRPYPKSYRDKWDCDHVRMPCSPLNRCAVPNLFGEKVIENRWDIICRSLRSDIGTSQQLENAIMKYNSQYIGKWNFIGLHIFINKHLTEEERDHFFETLLPAMVDMALKLPDICTQPVPLLKTGKDHYVTMSQKQIGCLLLNGFFCTFPRRTSKWKYSYEKWHSQYASFPEINFTRLFMGIKNEIPRRNGEKLKCLFNYFRRITTTEPCGTVTFHRQTIENFPNWSTSTRGMRSTVIKSSGFIETDGHGMLQVDFANKYVGGGILGQGCVQEEIRFIECPELIVSGLFVERFADNEVLIVTGVEQYNKHSGYGDTFKWEGDFKDQVPRDSWGRKYTQLVAIDATHFKNTAIQFQYRFVKRELNKAYCGFYENGAPAHLSAVATGNWGCGAFRGNPHLKFLIQLMAASVAGRSLLYFTFGSKKLKMELQKMYDFLNDKNLTVGDIWRLLMSYSDCLSVPSEKNPPELYDFIYSQFITKTENNRQKVAENIKDPFFDDKHNSALSRLFEDIDFDGGT